MVEDGESSGPFEDYEIRELIRSGKVTAESKIWHEGADGWIEAREVRVLEHEFEKRQVEPPPIPEELMAKTKTHLLNQTITSPPKNSVGAIGEQQRTCG